MSYHPKDAGLTSILEAGILQRNRMAVKTYSNFYGKIENDSIAFE
jgi:hypothetical protein